MIKRHLLSAGGFLICLLSLLAILCFVPDSALGIPALFKFSVWLMSVNAFLGVAYNLMCVYGYKTGVFKEYGSEDTPT